MTKGISPEEFQKLYGKEYEAKMPAQIIANKKASKGKSEKQVQAELIARLERMGYTTARKIHDELTTIKGKKYDEGEFQWFIQSAQIKGIYEVTGTNRPKNDYQGTMMSPGISDVMIYHFDTQAWEMIEVKREKGGRPSPEQKIKVWCKAHTIWNGKA